MPEFLKQVFIALMLVLFLCGKSLVLKVFSMNNQSSMVRTTFFDLSPFIIRINRCNESWFSSEDPFGRICVSNKMSNMQVEVLNITKEKNESKTLTLV